MFSTLYNNLVNWLASLFNNTVSAHNDFQTWFLARIKNLLDFIVQLQNQAIWFLTAFAVVLGMFVDVADWMANAFSSITLSGISAPSGTIFAPNASFSAAYGFVDAFFPFHELLSALVFLMPLYLAINVIRTTRAVLSLIQVNGWGVNN